MLRDKMHDGALGLDTSGPILILLERSYFLFTPYTLVHTYLMRAVQATWKAGLYGRSLLRLLILLRCIRRLSKA